MANIQLSWEVQGIISPEVSVSNMIGVIESKGIQHSGTFWTWENKVISLRHSRFVATCWLTLLTSRMSGDDKGEQSIFMGRHAF
jgi:hypothetical protein